MAPTRLTTVLVAAVLALPCPAAAQATPAAAPAGASPTTSGLRPRSAFAPSHLAAAESLMVAANMEALMRATAEQTVQAQLRAMPQLAPFADIMREFMGEQMSWASLEPEFAVLYADTFSEGELREITAFYRTPLGQKLLARTPEVMGKSMEISQRRVQAAMPKLMERVQARAVELQKEGKLPAPPAATPPTTPPAAPAQP